MPPLDRTPSHRGAIPSSHDASTHNRSTNDVRGAQQVKPAGSASHRGAIGGSHDASPHNPQTNQVRGGRTQDPGGWKEPAQVTAGQAAVPHSRSGPVVPTEHLVAEHLVKAGVVPARSGTPHGHSAPDANKQPAPASANHHDAKSGANTPTTQPARQTVSPSAVPADQPKSNTNSSVPLPATVTVTTSKSWLLSFERPVSDHEVAKWLFPAGNVPEGFVIRVDGNGSNPSQQWDVSYGDWKGDPKGDSIARMAQFRDLFTPYGLDLVNRALLWGEPTPQAAAEIKASDEETARKNAKRNDRIIPALNMSASEALKRMQPGAYELNGNFVWIGYKTPDRKHVREELQIVEKSATNEVFNNDIRFYLRHGLDLNDAFLAFNEQWAEIFNIEIAFAGTGAGYRFRDPAGSAAAKEAEAAGYAGLEGRLALNRVAVEKPESVVIVTEIAEDAGKLAARAETDYRLNGQVILSKPKTTGGGTLVVPPTPSRPKPAPIDWLHGIDPGPTLEREGPATSGGSSASALGPGRSPAAGGRTRPVNPNRQMAVGNDGPPQGPKAPATPDVPAAATHDTNGPRPEIRGDVKGGGVVLGEKNVVSGTIGSNTSNNDTGTLNLSEEGFLHLKAQSPGPVSGIVTSGQGQRVVRFRYDGERLTASVIAADNPSLAREFVTFRRQSIDLGKKLGAKVVRLQGEMVGAEVAAFLQENNFERVPGMDGILRLDIPIK